MKKWIVRILLLILLISIIAGSFIVYQGYSMYQEALKTISLSDKIEKVRQSSSYVTLDTLPLDYKNAVISVEDRRFYDHGPIDLIAIRTSYNYQYSLW